MKRSLRRWSFQTRLLVSFFIVILLATAAGYLFINQSVNRAFSDFTVRSFTLQDQLLLGLIVQSYNRTGSLEGLVEYLNRGPRDIPILLVDPERKVVFAPDQEFVGRRLSEGQLEGGQSILLASGEIWTVVPYRALVGRNALEQRFLRTTRSALWLSAFAASAAALVLALFLVRQTTNPLRQLEAATQRIARGDFDERVEIRSSDEIGRLAQAFNEMATSLKLSEEAKRRMIADISHELRTPLAAVRSALEGLRDGLIDPGPATFASLHDRVLLLTRLVGDLHQLALADAGQLSIERQPTQLSEVINGIVETVGFQIEDSGLTLEKAVDPTLPTLLVDANRIEQVILNLLANAIRHTPEGGRIEIRADRTGDGEVTLSVCDTGPGLAQEELDRIFERFYRADPAREGTGAGLGLSIAKALVEAHGGRIRAENSPQGGACFKVVLPIDAGK
jgi:signal transduction histidine kinase